MLRPASPKVNGIVLSTKAQVLNNVPGMQGLLLGLPTRFGRTSIESHAPSTVAAGHIGQRIGNGEPIARLRAHDASHLPVPDDLIECADRASAELFAVAKGKLVNVAEHEAMAYVEVGVSIFEIGISLIAEVAIIERARDLRSKRRLQACA